MRRLLPVIICLLLSPLAASAQLYAIRDSVANGYNFWLYVPNNYKDHRAERAELQQVDKAQDSLKVDSTALASEKRSVPEPMPIVVFLHGRSLSGTNLYDVRRYGTLDAIAAGRKVDALVIAPQVNWGDWWRPARVMNVIKWVSERYDVDSTRLYLLGMSLGGVGTLDFATTYPDETAAAMAFCGGSTRRTTDLHKLNKVPLWIMHGTADVDVPVSESRRVRNAMMEGDSLLPRLRYTEFEGIAHSLFARTFYVNEVYEWLFKHRTTDSLRMVDRTIEIPLSRLQKPNVYAGLRFKSVNMNVKDPKGVQAIPKTSAPPKAQYHTIKSGDTLGHIAIKYNTTVEKLCKLNNINKETILQLDKKLRVR